MTIQPTVERDQAAGYHKSSRFRCALHRNGRRIFISTRNAGSVTLAKRDAEDFFDCAIAWRDEDDPVVRARAEIEI